MIRTLFPATIIILLITQSACTKPNHSFRSDYRDVNTLIHETENLDTKPFLKAHMKNGDVCIFRDTWSIDTLKDVINGNGVRYNPARVEVFRGEMSISISNVAIFETNKKIESQEKTRIAALSILTGANAVGIGFCFAFPKACFGSCPTFYMNGQEQFHYADAEGFSNAISPSLEYTDIDALNNPENFTGQFSLTMKNEALETHCIRQLGLLAFPRKAGERIYHTRHGDFYRCNMLYPLAKASTCGNDISVLIRDNDRKEYYSLAGEKNLAEKEEILLQFDNIQDAENLGVVVNFRQTLMTTYLIYSAIGYMGDEVSDYFARLEGEKEVRKLFASGIHKELGGIEVHLWNETSGQWDIQGEFYETGPIAMNRQILPFKGKPGKGPVKLKLILNKGLWRIDDISLTNIIRKEVPVIIRASKVLNKGVEDEYALAAVNDSALQLISMPGSEYLLQFKLPGEGIDYELFLSSRGYYIEWMRSNWLTEKDPARLYQMLKRPKHYLRREAKSFKRYEKHMESEFWGSRIDTKTFSYED